MDFDKKEKKIGIGSRFVVDQNQDKHQSMDFNKRKLWFNKIISRIRTKNKDEDEDSYEEGPPHLSAPPLP